MGLRLPEVLIILVVLVLVFGANKIPQLGDALGRGIRNFKKASSEDDAIDAEIERRPGARPPREPAGQRADERVQGAVGRDLRQLA